MDAHIPGGNPHNKAIPIQYVLPTSPGKPPPLPNRSQGFRLCLRAKTDPILSRLISIKSNNNPTWD